MTTAIFAVTEHIPYGSWLAVKITAIILIKKNKGCTRGLQFANLHLLLPAAVSCLLLRLGGTQRRLVRGKRGLLFLGRWAVPAGIACHGLHQLWRRAADGAGGRRRPQ